MKILIVDDDMTNRAVLELFLRRDMHEIISAENGLEAITIFEHHKPDIIFMDVMMPVMDGYTATREIKDKCIDEFVPVVFLTTLTDEVSLTKCVECGGDDFLTKPYNLTLLRSKLDAMSRIRSLHQAVTEQKKRLELYHEKTEHEIQLAKHIFNVVTNNTSSKPPYIKIWSSTVSHFSGDLVLHEFSPSGRLNIMLGDFTGHGLASAIGALPTSDVFYTMTMKGAGIADIAEEINRKLNVYLPTGYFCAAALVNIDSKEESIEIWNGGMPPIILIGHDGKILRVIRSTKLPLGVAEQHKFDKKTQTTRLSLISSIILCSDGLIEVQDADGGFFGIDGLTRAVSIKDTGEPVIDSIRRQVEHFKSVQIPRDDLTLVEIRCDLPIHKQQDRLAEHRFQEALDTGWGIDLYMDISSLRLADPMPILMDWMIRLKMPDKQRQQVFVILSELINNAIDHGILELDSTMKETQHGLDQYYKLRSERLTSHYQGNLKIHIEKPPHLHKKSILIRIEDSGNGFDYADFISHMDSGKGYGRGIALVKTICKAVNYWDCGNIVEVEYNLEGESLLTGGKTRDKDLEQQAV